MELNMTSCKSADADADASELHHPSRTNQQATPDSHLTCDEGMTKFQVKM